MKLPRSPRGGRAPATQQKVLDYILAHQPIKRKFIVEGLGMNGNTLDYTLLALKHRGYIKAEGGVYVVIPQENRGNGITDLMRVWK